MKVLITGDSHIGVLKQGQALCEAAQQPFVNDLQVRALGGGGKFVGDFFADRGDHAEITEPRYRRNFERLPPSDESFDMLGLSGPLHTTRVIRAGWNQLAPWPWTGEGKAFVSTTVQDRIILDDVERQLAFIAVLQRRLPVFVIEAPRPFLHHRAVRSNGADKIALLDRRYRSLVRSRLAAMAVPVVELDPAWVDAQGFMDPAFRSDKDNDQHHCNARWGQLMLERVDAFLAQAPGP